MNVGVAEKTELTSAETQLKLGWDSDADDVTDDVTDDAEEDRLQVAGGGVVTLTNPVSRLRSDSGHRPPPLPPPDTDGSKVKRPL